MLKLFLRALAGAAAVLSVSLLAVAGGGQPTSTSPLAPPPNGMRKLEPSQGWHALVGASVHVSPEKTIDKATVVIRDGRIVSVGEGAAPAGAQTRDAAGLHIYAGFIEPYLEVDVPRPELGSPGAHWNPRVTPERSALDRGSRGIEARTAETLRAMGFTAAAISPRGGIFRGQSAVVSLARPSGDPSQALPRVYRGGAYQALSFETTFAGTASEAPSDEAAEQTRWSSYPGSQMGAIALIRQTLIDADWQQAARRASSLADPINALDALAVPEDAKTAVPLLFDVGDSLEAIRATKIGKEFSRPVALLGSGREYQRLDAIVESGAPIVLPLAFPRAPEVNTVGEANATELEDLMAWEQAPTNPRRVDAAVRAAGGEGAARLSLTTSKGETRAGRGGRGGRRAGAGGGSPSDGRDQFDDRLAIAIKHGLPPERALAMLTSNPARLLGVEGQMGTVEPGKVANLVVADGPLFMDRPDAPRKSDPGYVKPARIVEVWIDGHVHELKSRPRVMLAGQYELTLDPPLPAGVKLSMNISDEDPPEITLTRKTTDAAGHEELVDIKIRDFERSGPGLSRFTFSFEHEPFGEKGVFQNAGLIDVLEDGSVVIHGDVVRTSGRRMNWTARRIGPPAPRKPSLAGAWPMIFEQAAEGAKTGQAMLMFDRGNVATVQLVPGVRASGSREDGNGRRGGGTGAATVDKFEYDGQRISYEFDQAQVLMPDGALTGVAKVEARVDWAAKLPRMTGTVTTPEGKSLAWTATRRERNPFAGEWRVTQADGVPRGIDAADGLIIRIGSGGQATGGVAGGEQGGLAGPGGRGSSRERDRTTVKLTFLRPGKPTLEIVGEEVERSIGKIFFKHDLSKLGAEGHSSDELTVNWGKDGPEGDVLVGLGRLPDGSVHPYEAKRTPETLAGEKKETAAIAAIPEKIAQPFGPLGVRDDLRPERVAITGVTVWTCKDGTSDTVIEDGAVVISEGKIQYVGSSAGLPRLVEGYTMLDGTGKFVTPGIIDCHSHTGISRGVNEAGQAVTAEVRIGDVTDPNDVSWYRQLAGGVTCVNNLHGSANAIGGQSMVNKIRWGCAKPDDMHFEGDGAAGGSLPGIKFALGENPKQSNWGDRNTSRYPQTRMGVEMLIRDRFTAAREYLVAVKAGKARRDLELEALGEILEGKRLIHCHSYRQDEILMLCRVAQEFGFKIGTFQHILEGYKVADELAKWSGGGSSFSDWWAYKWEVFDAIPADGPIMAEQGVVVSYNSDSDEMARRLNVEAGKATKYSGRNGGPAIPPHEAYKFVTLNPAKQLHVQQRTGTLESGKDADLCLWSGPPISPTSRCEITWVEGRRVFSLARDAEQRTWIASERQRLIQKVLATGNERRGGRGRSESDDDDEGPVVTDAGDDADLDAGTNVSDVRGSGRGLMLMQMQQQADDWRARNYLDMLLRGMDPRWMRSGDCGCEMTGGEQ